MTDADQSTVLYPQHFLVVQSGDGVVLKRGSTEVAISGAGAGSVVGEIVALAAEGASRLSICQQFEPEDRSVVGQLLDALLQSRLLTRNRPSSSSDVDESNLDVWYWQFEQTRAQAARALDEANLVIVGLNGISEQLARSLRAAGVRAPQLVRDTRLDDASNATDTAGLFAPKQLSYDTWLAEKPNASSCVVGTSAFGNLGALLSYNRACVEGGQRFLPVFLQNSVGYVGPLVLPAETACLDCARTRWNAGLDGKVARQAVDEIPPDAQSIVGFHPAMASMLGDLAALELTKFFVHGLPLRRIGAQIEIQMMMPRLTLRNVLKLPRCPTCSPLKRRASVAIRQS